MTGEIINNNQEGDNGEWKILEEVHNSNWRDDIPEELDAEKESYGFQAFEDEVGYVSPETTSGEVQERIDEFALKK